MYTIRYVNMKPEFTKDGHSCQCSCCQMASLTPFSCFDKDFQLTTIQVSYNSIVYNSVEHIECCAWKLRFADSIDFSVTIWRKLLQNHIECLSKLSEGEHALGKSQCFEWFKKFKSGDFDVRNEHGKPPKKFEDSELQALLNEDDAQTQQQFADQLNVRGRLHTFEIHGKDPEDGKMGSTWTEWKTARKSKNHLRNAARQVQKKVSSPSNCDCDEEWIYFENLKRKRSWVTPGEPSTSTARSNRYGRKTTLCVW